MPATSPPSPSSPPLDNMSFPPSNSEEVPEPEAIETLLAVTPSDNTNAAESGANTSPVTVGLPSSTTPPQAQEDMLAYLDPNYHPFSWNPGQHAGLDAFMAPITAQTVEDNVADTTGSTSEEDSPATTTSSTFNAMSPAAFGTFIAQHTNTVEPLPASAASSTPVMLPPSKGSGAEVEDEEYQNEYEYEDGDSELSDDGTNQSDYTHYEEDEDDEDDEENIETSSPGGSVAFTLPPDVIASINASVVHMLATMNPQNATAPAVAPESTPTDESLNAQEVSDTATATHDGAPNVPPEFVTFFSNVVAEIFQPEQLTAAVTSVLDANALSFVPTMNMPPGLSPVLPTDVQQDVATTMTFGIPAPQLITSNESLLDFLNVIPPFASSFPVHRHRRPQFDAAAYIDTLEEVDISTIPAEDMKCAFCWLPFGTTDEDDPIFVYMPDPDEVPELSARQTVFRELPFCEARPDNDPVRTPCGHIFGRGCLLESLDKVDTLCPTCRRDLRPEVARPQPASPVLQQVQGGATTMPQ
jgi:hypothetical protein